MTQLSPWGSHFYPLGGAQKIQRGTAGGGEGIRWGKKLSIYQSIMMELYYWISTRYVIIQDINLIYLHFEFVGFYLFIYLWRGFILFFNFILNLFVSCSVFGITSSRESCERFWLFYLWNLINLSSLPFFFLFFSFFFLELVLYPPKVSDFALYCNHRPQKTFILG